MAKCSPRYPTVAKALTEAAVPPPKSGTVFKRLRKYKVIGNNQIYLRGEGRKARPYVWDYLHGHWEVYTKTGKPKCSVSNDDVLIEEFPANTDRKRLVL